MSYSYYPPQGPQRSQPPPVIPPYQPPSTYNDYGASSGQPTGYDHVEASMIPPPQGLPPKYHYQSPVPTPSQPSAETLTNYLGKVFGLNEQVEICIQTNRWVAGVIVGALYFFERMQGLYYKVSYQSEGRKYTQDVPKGHVRGRM
ncbi:hypothetical protein BDZ89DRAFT_1058439 [Hymenopellis radicata]|nr:hypothetical protein BDZ89DRAFT_1058439 [Hymenopellis radicata]